VYDPKKSVTPFLSSRGIKFTAINSLGSLPASGRVLVIGKDALTVSESTSSALAAYASTGRSVIVLDQANALRYQALTAEIDMAPKSRSSFGIEQPTGNGSVAWAEDLGHPIMRGLRQTDLRAWGGSLVYRNAYAKPARGARSLVQAGPRLQNTALVEVPTGKGIMILSQLAIGDNLSSNAVGAADDDESVELWCDLQTGVPCDCRSSW
jgi:beta-galactosidase